MAGHSKWANIKHKKAANDKKRGKLWSKLIREVTVAAKEGGGDIESNPRLRLAVDKARGANMPNDTVERAIKRGAGGDDDSNYDEIRYEGYAQGAVSVMVEPLTDTRNREFTWNESRVFISARLLYSSSRFRDIEMPACVWLL